MNLHLYKDKYFVKNIFKRRLSQSFYISHDQPMLDSHDIERSLNFQV